MRVQEELVIGIMGDNLGEKVREPNRKPN